MRRWRAVVRGATVMSALVRVLKHFHWVRSRRFSGLMHVLVLVSVVVAVAGQALYSADGAARAVIAAAREGREPPSCFGAAPDRVCVEPVVLPGKLPGQGPCLDPGRPCLSFGVAGGTAVLGDPRTEQPVKLPADRVRLVPAAGGAPSRCAAAGRWTAALRRTGARPRAAAVTSPGPGRPSCGR